MFILYHQRISCIGYNFICIHCENHFDYSIISGIMSSIKLSKLQLMREFKTIAECVILHQHHIPPTATNQ